MLKKVLHQALWGLVFALPTALFFSYYPVITLGSSSSMNFELSVPLIWLVVFDLIGFLILIVIWRDARRNIRGDKPLSAKNQKNSAETSAKNPAGTSATNSAATSARTVDRWGINFLGISDRKFFLLALFPLYATISIFWSMNPVRAVLTAGIIWLIFFAVFTLIYILPLTKIPRNFSGCMIKAILIPTIVVCGFCWLQCWLDIWGVGREQSLLCRGCVAEMFGFPHPSGFAIEPQFMGNLLLAPTLLVTYLLVFPQKNSTNKALTWSAALISSATLFITFSRGAIYAYCVALAIMFIFAIAQHKSRPRSASAAPSTAAGISAAKAQLSSAISKTPLAKSAFIEPAAKSQPAAAKPKTAAKAQPTATKSQAAVEAQSVAKVLSVAPAPSSAAEPHPADAPCGPRIVRLCLIPVTTFVFALIMQGTFALLGPTSSTFLDGVTKSLHHLSLGLVDFRSDAKNQPSEAPEAQETQETSATSTSQEVAPPEIQKTMSSNTPEVAEDAKSQASAGSAPNALTTPNTPVGSPEALETPSASVAPTDQAQAQSAASEPVNAQNQPVFDGYVAESTNIRLNLNSVALETWASAPGHPKAFWVGSHCDDPVGPCNSGLQITPTSILFGVGLGGAGTAMHAAHPDQIASPKEIVQNQPISLLLELGLVGVLLAVFALVIAFLAPLLPQKFVDGRASQSHQNHSCASQSNPNNSHHSCLSKSSQRPELARQGSIITRLQTNEFWSSPALPLLVSLVVAYVVTLNFFAGLPNALQIYLMPPLLLIIYRENVLV